MVTVHVTRMLREKTGTQAGVSANKLNQKRNIMTVKDHPASSETNAQAGQPDNPNQRRTNMGRVIVYEYVTLDGVMEAPEEWQFPYYSDDVAEVIKAQILEPDAILLGRETYEIFASYWPYRTHNEFGTADKLNSTPKFVVSSTLEKAEWNNSTLIKENVAVL
jgi:hypothetical protein